MWKKKQYIVILHLQDDGLFEATALLQLGYLGLCILYLLDFILTEEQRKDMSLEEQLNDLKEKLEMTQAIKSGSKFTSRESRSYLTLTTATSRWLNTQLIA